MVPKGRWYDPSDVQILGEAALRAIPVAGGDRGDCASSGTGPFHAGDRGKLGESDTTISRELRRNAATRSGGLEYRATTAQWHAERSARRAKRTKLALNATLRTYVEERLAGVVVARSGVHIQGTAVAWKGRRHGQRQDRRWARAWSTEQIARRLRIDFQDDKTMRISEETIYQASSSKGKEHCAANLRPVCEQGGCCGCSGRGYAGAARVLSRRDHD